ncbi:MAG: hypothetical protein R3F46_01790 [bacterium]
MKWIQALLFSVILVSLCHNINEFAFASTAGSFYTEQDIINLHTLPGGIPYQPKEEEDWMCFTNQSAGSTCPPIFVANGQNPCPCSGSHPTAAGWNKYRVVNPVMQVGITPQMNIKNAQGKYTYSGTIIHITEWWVCYDVNHNPVATCEDTSARVEVKLWDCGDCPT